MAESDHEEAGQTEAEPVQRRADQVEGTRRHWPSWFNANPNPEPERVAIVVGHGSTLRAGIGFRF